MSSGHACACKPLPCVISERTLKWGEGSVSRGGNGPIINLISTRFLFRVPLKFARLCIECARWGRFRSNQPRTVHLWPDLWASYRSVTIGTGTYGASTGGPTGRLKREIPGSRVRASCRLNNTQQSQSVYHHILNIAAGLVLVPRNREIAII